LDKLRPEKIRELFPDIPDNDEQTRLNRRFCGMIVAYFFLDINQDDIARIYGITQPTVNRQLHKALKLMQDRVHPDGMRSRGTPIVKFEMKKKEKKDKE